MYLPLAGVFVNVPNSLKIPVRLANGSEISSSKAYLQTLSHSEVLGLCIRVISLLTLVYSFQQGDGCHLGWLATSRHLFSLTDIYLFQYPQPSWEGKSPLALHFNTSLMVLNPAAQGILAASEGGTKPS